MSITVRASLVQQVYRVTVAALLDRLRTKPTAELLGVARSLLRDSGYIGKAASGRDRLVLQQLHRLYVKALVDAVEGGTASAAVLAEVGLYLHRSGFTDALGSKSRALQAAQKFVDRDMPFQ